MWKVIFAGAVATAVLVGVVAVSGGSAPRPEVRKVAPPAVPVVNQTKPAQQSVSAPTPPGALPTVAASPSRKLVAELQGAEDWRAFVLGARSRPEEGGHFYAMYVTNLCSMGIASMPHLAREAVGSVVAKTGTVSPTTISMTEKLTARCSSFAPNEASAIRQEINEAVVTDQRDPLLASIRRLSTALTGNDAQQTKEALRALLSLDDPLALYGNALLMRVMSRSLETKKGDLWFDGAVYGIDDPIRLSTFQLAVVVASCSSQAPCELDTQILLGCLGDQFCTDKREAYLRFQYVTRGGMTEAQFADAIALSKRIQQAVANHEADAFVR